LCQLVIIEKKATTTITADNEPVKLGEFRESGDSGEILVI
jgi:hypothetical protein